MSDKLSIGLVGAGVFGGYHAGKCASHERIDFVGIYDPDNERARSLAKTHDTKAWRRYVDMLKSCDAVIIACPAKFHGDMAIRALEAGKHLLIEKPLADNQAQGARILELAGRNTLVVQAGHQERFVVKAIGLDRVPERPARIIAQRMGKYSSRGTDVSATLDLMTHDLDLACWLMGGAPHNVEGFSQIVRSGTPDAALALLEFEDGSARLETSRVEEGYSRVMRLDYPSGSVVIDFNAKTLSHSTPFDLNKDFGADPMAKDSLGAATQAFVEAVLDGKPVPVCAKDGYRAMELALRIDGVTG